MNKIKDFYYRYLRYHLSKDDYSATLHDKYLALSHAVRSLMVDNWISTRKKHEEYTGRQLYYLSMEYILGKNLQRNIVNLGMERSAMEAATDLGFNLEQLLAAEDDFELGYGGKGRLAACFQDALATGSIPVASYGLRYDYALFKQIIYQGRQIEKPFDWLHRGHPWEIVRPEYACEVQFGGECVMQSDHTLPAEWINTENIIAIPYLVPFCGYRNNVVNSLCLWSARASEAFPPEYFNHVDYVKAVDELSQSGKLTKLLFPEENVLRSTESRLKQQFFFASASLQNIIRSYKARNGSMDNFDANVAIHLNGSRCAFAIVELMRLLVDVERIPWDKAWQMVCNSCFYTSHAVSKDDLESWPVYMIAEIFPRHLQIIYELNQMHLDTVRKKFGDSVDKITGLSLIEEGETKRIRMAQVAVLGSARVNGVSSEQTRALQKNVFKDFTEFDPQKFVNITNGIAHRRWMLVANRPLADLVTELIGESWITEPEHLQKLEKYADDSEVLYRIGDIKHAMKRRLSQDILNATGIELATDTIYDVQCKKINPYKRQVLQILNILYRFLLVKDKDSARDGRTYIFAGKASPSDRLGKQIIQLVHLVAGYVKEHTQKSNAFNVIFVPDYGISWAERLIPAADVSEQIATPLMEASGTSNMKFSLNGAITIASRSGSNNEMLKRVGEDNMFIFGTHAQDIPSPQAYNPSEILARHEGLAAAFNLLEMIVSRAPDGAAINPLLASLKDSDEYYVFLDFGDFIAKQNEIDALYKEPTAWLKKCLLNISRMGWSSADRAIKEYCSSMWKVSAL
ncbi:MAG: glycogen/starch/alpha-glucan family phosphorylase [Chitinivibrionales bacterium]|nr:glycogen/starch/alpha-glucan family phosphorylase [Chitinivibrionales bacterium]